MSRTSGLTVGFWLATVVAAGADCAPAGQAVPASPGWTLSLSAPCAPYRPVTVRYGPLEFREETGAAGTLRLTLPVLAGSVRAVISGVSEELEVPAPAGMTPDGFIWVSALDRQPGLLPPVGFPRGTEILPELALYAAGETPAALDVPVTDTRCGGRMAFSLLRDGWDVARTVTIGLPDCALTGAVIRVPLPSE